MIPSFQCHFIFFIILLKVCYLNAMELWKCDIIIESMLTKCNGAFKEFDITV